MLQNTSVNPPPPPPPHSVTFCNAIATPSPKCVMLLKNLTIDIKQHYNNLKRKKVRQGIIPGNSETLWDSVRLAKDQNI